MTGRPRGSIPWNKGLKGAQVSWLKGTTGLIVPWNKGKKTGLAPWRGKIRGPHTDETKAKMRAAALGKPKSPEHVANILKNWSPGKRQIYRGITMKSTYEVRFATLLDQARVAWEYEPRIFDLGASHYIPDFHLPLGGVFVEVKGYLGRVGLPKIDLFRQKYPEIPLIVVERDAIKAMERGEKSCPGALHLSITKEA